MSADQERIARVALSQLGEPGDLKIAGLTAEMGAVGLYEQLREQRHLDVVLRDDLAQRLMVLDPVRDLELAERRGIRYVVPCDAEWPSQVDDLEGAEPVAETGRAPLGLWVRGPHRLDDLTGAVAVVGSRSSSTYGVETTVAIASTIAASGRCVVSGAAFGIDHAAHRGALGGRGPTVAVLACGVDRAYPLEHARLLDHLAHDGAVVSEAAPGRAPTRLRFLSRNRVIAALTTGTVVVEAAARSGSLNTANWAGRLNRVVMGVPGPVTAATSVGVHHLIREGGAQLVTSGADVLELVGESGTHLVEPPRGEERPRDRLRKRDQQVLEAVPVTTGARVDAIARAAGIGLKEAMSTLTKLQGLGMAVRSEDGWRLAAGARQ